MLKHIKIDDATVEKVVEEFKNYVSNTKVIEDEAVFTYKVSPPTEEEATAEVIFTEKAYWKISLLLAAFDSEVAWYGVADRIEKGKYKVEDIVVFPQRVTGGTVTTDAMEIAKWSGSIPAEQYNRLRFHGHSHVNMGAFVSSVDSKDRKDHLAQIPPDDFFIFAVFNKRHDIHLEIYDLLYDARYDDNEIDFQVEGDDAFDFLTDAKRKVADVHSMSLYSALTDADIDRITEEYYEDKEDDHYGFE